MPLELLTICHMHPSELIPRHGIFLQRQAAYLEANGVNSTFLVPRPRVPWPLANLVKSRDYSIENALLPTRFTVHEAPFFRLPGRWFNRFEGWFMAQSIFEPARTLHKQIQFDVIWACPAFPDAVAALELKRRLSLPLATLSIGSDVMVRPDSTPLRKQIQQVLGESDLCVGVSESICRRMKELAACDPIRIFLGRDNALFRPADDREVLRTKLNLPQDAIVATYVGLLATTKGMTELFKAAKTLLKHERFHLVCVGDGPCMRKLAELPRARVHLVGEQPPEQVPIYLQVADFFVFPSYSEGMPQAILEAMHCGLPIVATDVGGTPEAVTPEDNGLLVAPRRSDLLLAAMERMIGDAEFRARAGQRSQEIASERFDSEANALKLANALRNITSHKSSPR